jgi:hypothetical protein
MNLTAPKPLAEGGEFLRLLRRHLLKVQVGLRKVVPYAIMIAVVFGLALMSIKFVIYHPAVGGIIFSLIGFGLSGSTKRRA